MKLKTAGVLTAATLMLAAGNANANLLFDIYAGATAGAGAATLFADHHDTTDNAQAYGAVLGIDIPLFRFEAEYNYLNEKDLNLHAGMINAYVKMPMLVVNPYLGLGAGMIFGGNAAHGIDIETTAAYQGMLGLTFNVPVLPIKVDAEARALYAADVFKTPDVKPDVLHYDMRLKLRYIF